MPKREFDHEIPAGRLPEGFAGRIDRPPAEPVEPRPAATVVLLRSGNAGLEVLLVRRSRTVGFVPGAYVFPGGRVDAADGEPSALARLQGTPPRDLARRLNLPGRELEAAAFLVAAFRETFEETGILPGLPSQVLESPEAIALRRRLLADEIGFHRVLEALDHVVDAGSATYIAHWVTPEAEPRRYDTRFFGLVIPRDARVRVEPGEITEAVWLEPATALARHRAGELPMIFPTLRTLEELVRFSTPAQVLARYRAREIPRILPRLVRTPTGVGIQVPEEVG